MTEMTSGLGNVRYVHYLHKAIGDKKTLTIDNVTEMLKIFLKVDITGRVCVAVAINHD